MKIEKRLIVLSGFYGVIGSVTFERTGEKCKARVNINDKRSAGLVVRCDKDFLFDISSGGEVSFSCPQTVSPKFFVRIENRLWSGAYGQRISRSEETEVLGKYAYGKNDTEAKVEEEKFEKPERKGGADYKRAAERFDKYEEYHDEAIAQDNYYPSNLSYVFDDGFECQESASTLIESRGSLRNLHKGQCAPVKQSFFSATTKLREADFAEKSKTYIDGMLKSGEKYDVLERLLPGSRWVRMRYDGSGRFYAVGIIGEPPDFIVYAVPSAYSVFPPRGLEDCGKWLPLDKSKPQGEGFWLIFQSAKSGETVSSD